MDDRRFDSLIRSLGAGASRRSVLKGLLGLGGAVAGGIVLDEGVEAARRPAPKPKPVSCPGQQIPTNGQCVCPPAAPHKCGPDCCTGTNNDPWPRPPTHTECCDNACCDGSCYGEELCCPTNSRGGERPPTHQICQSTDYGIECCPFEEDCCTIDGCCSTVCYGGMDDASSCCSQSDFCPGNDSPDLCCTDDFICCGAGTSENVCRDPNDENGCCTTADCPSGQTCENNQCVTSCSPTTVHIFAQTHGSLESQYICPGPFENVIIQIGLYPYANGACAGAPIATASTGTDSPAIFNNIAAGVYCALPTDSNLRSCLDCPDYGQGVGVNLTIPCGELFQWTIGICQQGQHCANGVCTDDDPCEGECTELEVCSNGDCACKPGTYNDFDAGCTLCSPGTYSTDRNAAACTICDLNSYQDQSGQTSCLPCAEGYYTEHTGATVCLECNCALGDMPPICECDSSPCSPGSAPNNGMCMPCAVGSASFDGTTCVACPQGSFAANTGQITCDPCAVGSYADTIGSTTCTACPEGSYQGAQGQASCLACGAGTYTGTTGSYTCVNCPLGAYAAAPGSTQCTSCAAGTYNNIVANYTCYSCPVGAYSDTGADECTLCAVGTYNDTVGSAVCTECSAGYFANAPGTTQCTPCAAGSFASNTGSFSCTSCSIGTYAANPGSSQCIACSAGSYTNQTGSAACLLCDCGATCSPMTGTCGSVGVGVECSSDDDCFSGICGCGAPPGFADCICRNNPCFAQGEDCSSGYGAAWCCAGDCNGNNQNGFFCIPG